MDRDVLLVGLVALVCGTLAWSLAGLRAGRGDGPAWLRERRAWRTVIAPLAVVACGSTLLVGWALQEPATSDEHLAPLAWVCALLVIVLWLRAGVRFVQAIVARPAAPLAVVGILRPRVVLDPRLERVLDPAVLVAGLAHEAAHVRHRDPLRIALGGLATDLQWPWRRPETRLAAWRVALEEARDDEAIAGGIAAEDLALAIVGAARFATGHGGAALAGDHAIVRRIERLLDGAPRGLPPRRRGGLVLLAMILVASLMIGLTLGDDLVRLLPGVLG
ncbi:MAG TPA: hypothetical protein VFQ53_36225 [Kofleriaceae bacterium]|nr:hypothetical protein [Kofleriaceae bacterium]